MPAVIQIFGTKKCRDTQKAERFFKERGISCQFVNLNEKGASEGELESMAGSIGTMEDMIDKEGKEYRKLNLEYLNYDVKEILLEHPLLLKTPVVRKGNTSYIGYRPGDWAKLIDF
ncbi:MAG: arsenate reductase family protein [Spirochaetales bacterium]|nr:arsenate reductase family protein [Spirochaetales bacterium]